MAAWSSMVGMFSARICMLLLVAVPFCPAQTDFPGNPLVGPKKYTKREVGGGAEPGASVQTPAGPAMVRYVTHIILHEVRFWTSVEGTPLAGKLIAFEDLIAEAPRGAPVPQMPAPPPNPTMAKDGKIRLLVENKPREVPLARLSWQDRELIDGIQAALDKKAAEGR